jgi:RES domain
VLYRLFPSVPGVGPTDPGGPLFAPRMDQGGGRHDNPDAYGALYLSRVPTASVAELLIVLRTQPVLPQHLTADGFPYAIASIDDSALDDLLDLDDPANLVTRNLRPSRIATRDRGTTQPVALTLYREGVDGFEWWSTIEASWINVTLFADRAVDRLSVTGPPEALTLDSPWVREAAEAVGVALR